MRSFHTSNRIFCRFVSNGHHDGGFSAREISMWVLGSTINTFVSGVIQQKPRVHSILSFIFGYDVFYLWRYQLCLGRETNDTPLYQGVPVFIFLFVPCICLPRRSVLLCECIASATRNRISFASSSLWRSSALLQNNFLPFLMLQILIFKLHTAQFITTFTVTIFCLVFGQIYSIYRVSWFHDALTASTKDLRALQLRAQPIFSFAHYHLSL